MEEEDGEEVIYIDASHWRMQPRVLLERLSEEDIKFYTKRRSRRRIGRLKKEIASKNLRDVSRVDFSLFEEYRRSRKSFLKKKENGKANKKTSAGKTKNATSKKSSNERVAASEGAISQPPVPESGAPDHNTSVEPPAKKPRVRKKKADSEPAVKTKQAKKKKNCVKRRKAMIIESDSDCSVENYGIIYSTEKNIADMPFQNHTHLPPAPAPPAFKTPATQPSLPSGKQATASEVLVNESDILSALEYETEEAFYDQVMTDKYPDLSPVCKKSQSSVADMGCVNKQRTGASLEQNNKLPSNGSNKPLKCLNQNLSGGRGTSLSMKLTSFSETLMADGKYDSEDMMKEFDVVSKIIQEMEDFQKKQQKTRTIPTKTEPAIQVCKKDTSLKNSITTTATKDSPSICTVPKAASSSDAARTVLVTGTRDSKPALPSVLSAKSTDSKPAGSSAHPKNVHHMSVVPPRSREDVFCAVREVMNSLLRNVEERARTISAEKPSMPSRRASKEVRICIQCHSPYRPIHTDGKNVCTLCRSPVMKIDPTLRKKQYSPVRKRWNMTRPNIIGRSSSPLSGKYSKEDTGLLKSKFIKIRSNKNNILKCFSPYDQRRLMYKGGASGPSARNAKAAAGSSHSGSHLASSKAQQQQQSSKDSHGNKSVPSKESKRASRVSKTVVKSMAIPKIGLKDVFTPSGCKQNVSEERMEEDTEEEEGEETEENDNSCEETANWTSKQTEGTDKRIPSVEGKVEDHCGAIPANNSKGVKEGEKGKFTIKNIEKGLYLMTFPEPDKELDLSENSIPVTSVKCSDSAETSSKPDDDDDDGREDSKNIPVSTENSENSCSFDKIEYRYVIPQVPTVIVAEYAKANSTPGDFHLSSVSFENNGVVKSMSVEKSGVARVEASVDTSSPVSSVVPPDQSLLPVAAPAVDKVNCDKEVPNALQATSVVPVAASNAVVPVTTSSPRTQDQRSESGSSSWQIDSQKSMSMRSSLVSHELDAVAILSILDLDGNEAHAQKLLDNLLKKEIQDLHRITEMSVAHGDGEVKDIINAKIHTKLGKIKSLNIARALSKKYGTLPKIVEAVLSKPSMPEMETNNSSCVSPSSYDDRESLLDIKAEKVTKRAQDCLYAKENSSNTDNCLVPYVPAAPPSIFPPFSNSLSFHDPTTPPQMSDLNQLPRTEPSYTVSEPPEMPVRVKSESSSSCMMSSCSSPGQSSLSQDTNFQTQLSSFNTTATPLTFQPAASGSAAANVNSSSRCSSAESVGLSQSSHHHHQQQQRSAASVPSCLADLLRRPGVLVSVSNPSPPGSLPVTVTSSNTENAPSVIAKTEKTQETSSCLLQCLKEPSSNTNQLALPAPPPQPAVPTSEQSRRVPQAAQSLGTGLTSGPNNALQAYRPILPAVSAMDRQPCPNRTAPFSPPINLQPALLSRGAVSHVPVHQFQRSVNSGMLRPYNPPVSTNPLRVQQVVLSGMQTAMSSQPSNQNSLAVMPYNYAVAQQQQQQQQQQSQVVAPQLNCGANVLFRLQFPQHQQQQQQQQQQQPQQLSNMLALAAAQSTSNPQTVFQHISPASQNVRIAPAPPLASNSQNPQAVSHSLETHMCCVVCGKLAHMRCKQCAKVVFCGTECARIFWNRGHKLECKPSSGVT